MAERTAPGEDQILRPNLESVLRGLFNHAEDKLSDSELSNVALLREDGETMVGHVSSLALSVGCLVAADGDHDSTADMAGNYQSPEDVSQLLWTIAEQLDVAKALLNVSGFAEEAIERRASKARDGQKVARHG